MGGLATDCRSVARVRDDAWSIRLGHVTYLRGIPARVLLLLPTGCSLGTHVMCQEEEDYPRYVPGGGVQPTLCAGRRPTHGMCREETYPRYDSRRDLYPRYDSRRDLYLQCCTAGRPSTHSVVQQGDPLPTVYTAGGTSTHGVHCRRDLYPRYVPGGPSTHVMCQEDPLPTVYTAGDL